MNDWREEKTVRITKRGNEEWMQKNDGEEEKKDQNEEKGPSGLESGRRKEENN